MEILGNIKTVPVRIPQPAAQPILSSASQPALPAVGAGEFSFDASDLEAARFEKLNEAARNVPQPLGTMSFTMFKDVAGQVITRFFDKATGKAVYIPEPQLLRLAQASNSGGQGLLNISA